MEFGRRSFLCGAAAFGTMSIFGNDKSKATKLKNGSEFMLNDLPQELTAHVKRGGEVRFLVEESVDCKWNVKFNSAEGRISIEHREKRAGVIIGKFPAVQTPMLCEFTYGRQGDAPLRTMRLVVYTIPGKVTDFRYPDNPEMKALHALCKNRGLTLTDWHIHIRGGMTVEMAAQRERECPFIRSSAMENHGREWEIFDNARLRTFAQEARKVKVDGRTLPVGIQVNDRDWFKQINAETRKQFDYILADTMIMGELPNGRANRLWLVDHIDNPEEWMKQYFAHTMQVLNEPIDILANPTYLPKPLSGMYDQLWTDNRMKKVIGCAVERKIALEIQAESLYPNARFLKMAKQMGAKFSFGTNNFDPMPKKLSRWYDAIENNNLNGDDVKVF